MSNGVTPREVISITLSDTVVQTIDSVGIQATTGGVLQVINHAGDTVAITLSDGQIIPLNIQGLILQATSTTAAGIIAYA